MASNLTIELEAPMEIEDAIDWYESKQIGLGDCLIFLPEVHQRSIPYFLQ